MIDYRHFQYAGAPRTGTTWIIHALHACGLGNGSKTIVHEPFDERDKLPLPRIASVRHPHEWLASYYTNIYPAVVFLPEIDKLHTLPGETFDQFVESYLEQIPGQIGRIFDSYQADLVLRLEDQPFGLQELLESFDLDGSKCLGILPVNATTPKRKRPRWTPSLKVAVSQAESHLLENYEYWT